jgi:hypothetical protein
MDAHPHGRMVGHRSIDRWLLRLYVSPPIFRNRPIPLTYAHINFLGAFIPNFSCLDPAVFPDAAPCTKSNNQGWRYVWYASGSLVFVMSIARLTVIKLKETPKFLVGEGRDAECVETLQFIANKYNRPCSLTLEKMNACGTIDKSATVGKSKWALGGVWGHIQGLYSSRRIGISTSLIWLSWTLIGLAYPLYNVFLPKYLESRGAQFGQPSPYITWRNYTLVNFSGIWGPVLAGWMCGTRLGRKYTMVIGALVTMAFFFAYTQVRTATQNVSRPALDEGVILWLAANQRHF